MNGDDKKKLLYDFYNHCMDHEDGYLREYAIFDFLEAEEQKQSKIYVTLDFTKHENSCGSAQELYQLFESERPNFMLMLNYEGLPIPIAEVVKIEKT